MGAGLQGAGRPVWVINDSDRPDLTHSITLCLAHQLVYHSGTRQPNPRLALPHLTINAGQERCIPRTPDNILPRLSATSQPEVSPLSAPVFFHDTVVDTVKKRIQLRGITSHFGLKLSVSFFVLFFILKCVWF